MSAREEFPAIREAEKTMASGTVNDFGKICGEGETTPFEIEKIVILTTFDCRDFYFSYF